MTEPNKNQKALKCSGGGNSINLCVNQHCKQASVYVCGIEECKCQNQHSKCLKSSIKTIITSIRQKIHKTTEIKQFITDTVKKVIDQINKMTEQVLDEVQQRMRFTQLYPTEKMFLDIYETNKDKQKFLSRDSALLWKITDQKFQFKANIFDETKVILNTFQSQATTVLQKVKASVVDLTKKQILPSVWLAGFQKQIQMQMSQKSSICKDSFLSERMIKFFPRKLKKVTKMYKASEHNFSIAKFYELCGATTHIVIICLTQKDKIFGGYTPFNFYNGSEQWVADGMFESFLFSLTHNDKFDLKNSAYAIYRRSSKDYIQFGNSQLRIGDAAQNNPNNYNNFNCNSYYFNSTYKNSDKNSYLKLNGTQSNTCKLKQWQVWKIDFAQ